MIKSEHTQWVKSLSQSFGFSFCGISKAEKLVEEEDRLNQWLKKGYHGKMAYLENNFDKRLDPTLLVPGAKSVISLIFNYFPEKTIHDKNFKVAKYAYGNDYHNVVKEKLALFVEAASAQLGAFEGRIFVDSAPVMERQWAAKSGLGWLGKNTLLLNNKMGSFFFIANIISNWTFDYDQPIKDYCGSCTACIDACPTDALHKDGFLDATKCISYLTIELKEEFNTDEKKALNNWIFGCDICQDVCPWNRFSKTHNEPELKPSLQMQLLSEADWKDMTAPVFKQIFKKSAIKRTGYKGLMRNIEAINCKT